MAGSATAQGLQDLRFSHLTDKDGLSNNEVKCFTQDADGVLWIGTENGLNRFDGYGFRCFFANPNDSQSIQSDRIQLLRADTHGNVWGSTPNGVFSFDTRTQRAQVYKSIPTDTSLPGNPFRPGYIYLDTGLLPWVSTDYGLFHFTDNRHFQKVHTGITHSIPREALLYGGLIDDNTGGLWSCWGHTIFRLDPNTKRVLQSFICPDTLLITGVLFDRYNHCWVSTWGRGIYRFNPAGNAWTPFSPSDTRPVVFGMAEWIFNGKPYIVFTCSTPSLLFVNEEDTSTYTYPFDQDEVTFETPPFVDRQNILWVPSNSGIYYATPSNNLFQVINIPVLINTQGRMRISNVYNMREDSTGYWISKRDYGGLFWYDKHWNLIKWWDGAPSPKQAIFRAPGAVAGEVFDFQRVGREMFITTETGVSILNLETGKWTHVEPSVADQFLRMRTIIVENEHKWWIRSFNRGVFIFDPLKLTFEKHYLNGDTCTHCLPHAINYLIRDKRGDMYATTSGGLYKRDTTTDTFEKVPLNEDSIKTHALYGLACDADGVLWIGSENSLFTYNPQTGTIGRVFRENNKIGIVFRICTDDHQNIWFNSNTGYWCWLRKPDKVVHFEFSLGLPKTAEGDFYKTSDGLVYGGGKDAVVRFYPDRLMNYRVTARTRILDAMVGDSIIPIQNKRITLTPEQNSLSVDFDVINYDLVGTNQYLYRLTPGTRGWQRSETGHLSFYDLHPGNYTLDVKGASKLTGNDTNTDSIVIVVNPYWYQSGWFKAACIIGACLVVSYVVRYRIRAIRKEGAIRQKMVEMEMTALRAQMNPHFIFNSLNSIENFIMQNEKRLASDYLNKFATLIRMILENSRKTAVPLAKDMEAMQLYVDLEKLRFEDKFQYITEVDEILLKGDYRVAPLLIQPFVENAIIHGLAPSAKADLYLRITVHLRGDYLVYTIEDNGIGRRASMERKGKHRSLGIQISKERMDMLNTQNNADIVDLYDESGNPMGTRVLLTIKID